MAPPAGSSNYAIRCSAPGSTGLAPDNGGRAARSFSAGTMTVALAHELAHRCVQQVAPAFGIRATSKKQLLHTGSS